MRASGQMPMTADRQSGCTHAGAHSSEPAAPAHTTGRERPQAPRRHPTEPSTCPSYHLSRPRRTCPPTAVATRTRQGGCAGSTRAHCPPQPTPVAGHVGRRRKPPERARQNPNGDRDEPLAGPTDSALPAAAVGASTTAARRLHRPGSEPPRTVQSPIFKSRFGPASRPPLRAGKSRSAPPSQRPECAPRRWGVAPS